MLSTGLNACLQEERRNTSLPITSSIPLGRYPEYVFHGFISYTKHYFLMNTFSLVVIQLDGGVGESFSVDEVDDSFKPF